VFRCSSQSPCTLLTRLAVSTLLPTTVAQAKHVLWSSLGVVLRPPTILVVGARQGYKNGEHVFLTLAATPSLYGIPQLVVVGDALNEDERRMLLGESSRDCVVQRGLWAVTHYTIHVCACHRRASAVDSPGFRHGRRAGGAVFTVHGAHDAPCVRMLHELRGWAGGRCNTITNHMLCAGCRYEGFGLPLLEAMACGTCGSGRDGWGSNKAISLTVAAKRVRFRRTGCPVICSKTAALLEVGGDAPAFVESGNIAHIGGALTAVVTDEARRAAMARRGLAQAAKYRDGWERAAGVLVDAVAATLNGSQ